MSQPAQIGLSKTPRRSSLKNTPSNYPSHPAPAHTGATDSDSVHVHTPQRHTGSQDNNSSSSSSNLRLRRFFSMLTSPLPKRRPFGHGGVQTSPRHIKASAIQTQIQSPHHSSEHTQSPTGMFSRPSQADFPVGGRHAAYNATGRLQHTHTPLGMSQLLRSHLDASGSEQHTPRQTQTQTHDVVRPSGTSPWGVPEFNDVDTPPRRDASASHSAPRLFCLGSSP
jgi:hypothetical protein